MKARKRIIKKKKKAELLKIQGTLKVQKISKSFYYITTNFDCVELIDESFF